MKQPFTHLSSLISLIIHGVLISICIISWHSLSEKVEIGTKSTPIIQAYFYREAKPLVPLTHVTHSKPILKFKALAMHPEKKVEHVTVAHQPVINSTSQSVNQIHNTLLSMLHAAIQQQQQYPEAALTMQRQGSVTLSFTLEPDGTVRNLQVAHSSGTVSLDDAALAAVNNAVPFSQVKNYLHSSQEFSIDVVFKLNSDQDLT